MKRFSSRTCILLLTTLVCVAVFALAGCNRGEVPTTLPVSSVAPSSEPESSEPESSSSEEPSSSEESSSTPVSSSKPASSTGGSGGTGTTNTSTSGKVYSTAVTSSKKETFRSVKITASGVSLSNKTVTGDLVIDKGVGNGEVTLQNVTVGGTIYVYGGGENSIYLDSVTAKTLVSASTVSLPRIVAKGATVIDKTQIRYDTLLEHNRLNVTATGFTSIETVNTPQSLTVLKLTDISMNTVTLNYDTKLYLKGSSSIGSVIANKPSYIEGGDKVGLLFCYSNKVSIDTAPAHIADGSKTYQPTIKDEISSNPGTLTPLTAPSITFSGTEIRWNAVSGASNGYEVRVNRSGSTVYVYKTLSSSTRVVDIAQLLNENAAPTGTYQVRVSARATSSRDTSAYSNTISVPWTSSYPELSLTGLTLNGTTDITKFVASWTSAGATKGYNVTVATNASFSNKKYETNLTAGAATSLDLRAAMGANFVPIVPTAPYHIRITAKSAFEQLSVVGEFTVTRAPTPTNVDYDGTTQKLTWDAMTTLNKYRVTIGSTTYTVNTNQFDLSSYAAGSYSAAVVTVGTTGSMVNSNSNIKPFTKTTPVTPSLPDIETVTLARHETENLKLNLSWSGISVPAGVTYKVDLYKDEETTPVQTASGLTTTSYEFTVNASGSYTATVTAQKTGYTSSHKNSTAQVINPADLDFEGRGTLAEPYLISSAALFKNIEAYAGNGYYFEQTASFTVTAAERITVAFNGHYNGQHNLVDYSIAVSIDAPGADNVGLFSTISASATVSNITISAASSVVGRTNVGMIAGINNGTIQSCNVANTDASSVTGTSYVGMIVGTNNGTIDDCDVENAASAVTGTSYVGGICGLNNGTIQNCTYSGLLKQTGEPATTVENATAGFGLICGANTSAVQTTEAITDTSSNSIADATYKDIGMVGANP